ncbi:MAG: exonuclease domain-containing protein [Candidatus Hydrogenedentota bacterium]
MFEYQCPHCKVILSIPEQFIGTTGTCRKCGNKITIELSQPNGSNGSAEAFSNVPPTLVAFHCQATGPSARKCNITELGAVKFSLNGEERDTFWSFANPGHMIPPRITDRTGITDEMVANSPFSNDVVKQWFDWIGPNAILFSHHAHFDAKFVTAALLKDDITPPILQVIDVIAWARKMGVPIQEYRLTPLLDHIGFRMHKTHRTMETCQGIAALAAWLLKRTAGAHVEIEHGQGMLGRLVTKKHEAVNEDVAYRALREESAALEAVCEADFYEQVRYEARLKRVKSHGIAQGVSVAAVAAAGPDIGGRKHAPDWYQEKSRRIERYKIASVAQTDAEDAAAGGAQWEYILLEASQTRDTDEQMHLCIQAVEMGAADPWPYERLTGFYIQSKDYEAAQQVCEKYFESGAWKMGRFAEHSAKLLKRLEKLERKLMERAGAR